MNCWKSEECRIKVTIMNLPILKPFRGFEKFITTVSEAPYRECRAFKKTSFHIKTFLTAKVLRKRKQLRVVFEMWKGKGVMYGAVAEWKVIITLLCSLNGIEFKLTRPSDEVPQQVFISTVATLELHFQIS